MYTEFHGQWRPRCDEPANYIIREGRASSKSQYALKYCLTLPPQQRKISEQNFTLPQNEIHNLPLQETSTNLNFHFNMIFSPDARLQIAKYPVFNVNVF